MYVCSAHKLIAEIEKTSKYTEKLWAVASSESNGQGGRSRVVGDLNRTRESIYPPCGIHSGRCRREGAGPRVRAARGRAARAAIAAVFAHRPGPSGTPKICRCGEGSDGCVRKRNEQARVLEGKCSIVRQCIEVMSALGICLT